MEGTNIVSESRGFPTLTDVGVGGSALLISAAYVAIYHFGEQLAAVVPSVVLKGAPFLLPQAWAFGIAVTAVAFAALYIGYSIWSQCSGGQSSTVGSSAQSAKTVTDEERIQNIIARLWIEGGGQLSDKFFPATSLLPVLNAGQSARLQQAQKALCITDGAGELGRELIALRGHLGHNKYLAVQAAIYPNGHGNPVEESYALAWGIRVYEKMVEVIYANNPANQGDVDFFKALVGLEYLKTLVQEDVPSDITELKPKIKDEWPTENVISKLFGYDRKLIDQFKEITKGIIMKSGAKKFCLDFAEDEIGKVWANEYYKKGRKEEGDAYFTQYFERNIIGPSGGLNVVIKDEALVLQKGMDIYKQIIDAMQAVKCPNMAQMFKERVHYKELEKELPASREQKDKLS